MPRDKNDDNSTYTMSDAVFAVCFLHSMNRKCDIGKFEAGMKVTIEPRSVSIIQILPE